MRKTYGCSCFSAKVTNSLLIIISITALLKFLPINCEVSINVCDSRDLKTVIHKVCTYFRRKKLNLSLSRLQLQRKLLSVSDETISDMATLCCVAGCTPRMFSYLCE